MRTTPLTPEEIAQVCHVANQQLQRVLDESVAVDWDDLDDETKASVIHGVRVAQESIDNGPEELHRQWVMVKKAQGWTLGSLDRENKKHPNLVPWEKIAWDQQLKDRLFCSVVRSLSNMDE